jgi:hypothetical protein
MRNIFCLPPDVVTDPSDGPLGTLPGPAVAEDEDAAMTEAITEAWGGIKTVGGTVGCLFLGVFLLLFLCVGACNDSCLWMCVYKSCLHRLLAFWGCWCM